MGRTFVIRPQNTLIVLQLGIMWLTDNKPCPIMILFLKVITLDFKKTLQLKSKLNVSIRIGRGKPPRVPVGEAGLFLGFYFCVKI